MRLSNRLSLVVIAFALVLLGPLPLATMKWNGLMWRALAAIYAEVWQWLAWFVAAVLVVIVLLSGDSNGMNKR